MINLYQLQVFLAVVERGTFSAAASALHLTQPAISLQVQALEKSYGVRLFNRQGQHLELTEAGYALLEPARHLLIEAQQVEERFSAEHGILRGRLNFIHSHSSNGVYLLPQLLAAFSKQAPHNVQFSLQSTSEEHALQMLFDAQTHFAVLGNEPRHKTIEALLLNSDDLILALPAAHPWNGQQLEINALNKQTFILGVAGSELRRVTEAVLRTANLNLADIEIISETDDVQLSAEMVRCGLGLAFLYEHSVYRLFSQGQLGIAYLKSAGPKFCRETWLARAIPTTEDLLPPAQRQFWDFTCSHVNQS
jgi:DNA-binding transcriptional LysR family regulator